MEVYRAQSSEKVKKQAINIEHPIEIPLSVSIPVKQTNRLFQVLDRFLDIPIDRINLLFFVSHHIVWKLTCFYCLLGVLLKFGKRLQTVTIAKGLAWRKSKTLDTVFFEKLCCSQCVHKITRNTGQVGSKIQKDFSFQ